MQNYLYRVYQNIVPLQFALASVPQTNSPYAVQSTDVFIGAAASAGAATVVNLPAATGSGRVLIILKTDSNAHNITITPNGADTINGSNSSINLASQYDILRIADWMSGAWLKW
jgi:hypothetical protein